MAQESRGTEQDKLADWLARLFTDVSAMVKGDLQGANTQLLLLEKMNQRVAEEYSDYGGIASGLRTFVQQMNEKSRGFEDISFQIDAIDRQFTDLEAVVSMLDNHVSLLEKKVESACQSLPS